MEINIRVTRRELIQTKSRIKTAKRGLELLKLKRSSLILEFFNLVRKTEKIKSGLKDLLIRGAEAIKVADAVSGRITVERIAEEQGEKTAVVSGKNVMGLIIPNVEIDTSKSSPSETEILTIPTSVYDAKNIYSKLLTAILEVSEREMVIRKVLKEIYKLNRRTNALENYIIPAWESKVKYIKQSLDDMERDRLISIKFIKNLIS